MQRIKRNWKQAIILGAALCTIVGFFLHNYPIAPVSQTVTSTTVVSLQTTALTTATTTQVTTSTSTTIATASTTAVTTATKTETATTTEVTSLTISSPSIQLLVTLPPQHQWVLLTNGTRFATIPANESETFTIQISNTGQSPIRLWGMVVSIGYDGSFTYYHEQLLQPGDSVELPFVFGTNISRPLHATFSNIVFRIIGDGWSKDESIIIYLEH
jgi:hypothetical protein